MFRGYTKRWFSTVTNSIGTKKFANCKTIVVAPGQGKFDIPSLTQLNQYYHSVDAIREVVDTADAALPIDITQYIKDPEILNDPQVLEKFQMTSIQQPLILLSSVITNTLLKSKYNIDLFQDPLLRADYSIGHSLGEITMLSLNDIINLEDSLNLANSRGQYMEEMMVDIEDNEDYGMMALMFQAEGYDRILKYLTRDCDQEKISISNINNYQQIVISGKKSDMSECVRGIQGQLANDRVWKSRVRAVELPVKIPFHNPILKCIQIDLIQAFGECISNSIMCEQFPVLPVSNLNGEITKNISDQISNIIQVTSKPVQFLKCLETVSFNNDEKKDTLRFVNFGPGDVTCNLIDKFLKDLLKRNTTLPFSNVENISLNTNDEIERFAELYTK